MEWRKLKHKYGPHSNRLYLGKFHVATVTLSSYSRTEDDKYSCGIHLPGMKDLFTNSKHRSEEVAMEFAHDVVERWVGDAGLNFKDCQE